MITVAIQTGRSPVYINVNTDDEHTARVVAYRFVYYGETDADQNAGEFPVTDAELAEYTEVVATIATLTPVEPS